MVDMAAAAAGRRTQAWGRTRRTTAACGGADGEARSWAAGAKAAAEEEEVAGQRRAVEVEPSGLRREVVGWRRRGGLGEGWMHEMHRKTIGRLICDAGRTTERQTHSMGKQNFVLFR